MTTGIVTALVILLILAAGYGGYQAGVFDSLYGLFRELLAFMVAMTFLVPLRDLAAGSIGTGYLTEGYYELFAYFALLIAVFALGRWLRTSFTVPEVKCLKLFDDIGGVLFGACHGLVITGIILVGWSLMPIAKYIPGDHGHINTESLVPDSGGMLLSLYSFASSGMGGDQFLLDGEPLKSDANGNGEVDKGEYEDLNGNGKWDPGWMWKYRHHADLTPEDLSGGVAMRDMKWQEAARRLAYSGAHGGGSSTGGPAR